MEIKSRNNFFKYAIPVMRIIIGTAFLLSGVFKLIDIQGFQKVIESLGLLGGPLPFLASIILPVMELILGSLLALGIYIGMTALHLNVLVVIFSWVTFYVLGSRPDLLCGCFGGFFDMTFSIYHFIILFIVFVLNLVIAIEPIDTWTLQKVFREKITAAKKMLMVEILTYILISVGIILIGIAVYINFRGTGKGAEAAEKENAPLTAEEDDVDLKAQDELRNSGQESIRSGDTGVIIDITVDEAYEAYLNYPDLIFVDVRSEAEYESGHIKGALLIPLSLLEDRLGELTKDEPVLVYCNGSSCNRSGAAARILETNGFKEIYDLTGGGIDEWIEKGYPNE